MAQPRYQTLKKNVNLGAGQTLGYLTGKGYYAKAAPTIKQQAIAQVNAVNKVGTSAANVAANQATLAAKNQAAQALGFQHSLADITQGDAGRIYDAYGNAAQKVSAYGDLALASTGDSSRSAAEQAQNYLGTVGPDVGADTRPDISGALRALGATGVGDVAGGLKSQGAYAQERQQNVRDAQLMRLADIGANATYQGAATAKQLRGNEVTRQAASRASDVQAAVTALKTQALATDDQRMKDKAFSIEIQQKRVDLAAAKLANATGEIAKAKAQKELDNYQSQLDASLASTRASTAATIASTAGTKATTKATIADTKAGGTGAKGLTPYQQQNLIKQANDQAAKFYSPPPPKGLAKQTVFRANYQDALPRLMSKFGLTEAQAVDILNVYYKEPGLDGRPAFDFRERAQLRKFGFKPGRIQAAMNAFVLAKRNKPFSTQDAALYQAMVDKLNGQ